MNYDKIITRCFCEKKLEPGIYISLLEDQYKHIVVVLRVKINHHITLFNEQYGEFLAKIHKIDKHSVQVYVVKKIKDYKKDDLQIILAYSPLKKNCNDFVIEKSTELGIKKIVQIITERTVNKPILEHKITQKCILSAQQCGRIDIPNVMESISLKDFINNHNTLPIFWLNEDRNSIKLVNSIEKFIGIENKIIILIGPEGGFSDKEKEFLYTKKNVNNVYLDTNILRAETAVIAAIVAIKTKYNYL